MEKNRFFPSVAAVLVAIAGLLWPLTGNAEPGEGLRAGDLKLNPRLRLSGVYDQNIFRLNPNETDAGAPTAAPGLDIAPGLKISTLDATSVDLSFDGELEWEQYFSRVPEIQGQSGLQGNGLLGITLNPNGAFSLKLNEDLTYRNDPPPFPYGATWNRLINRAGASVIIHPGDEILNTTLGYDYVIYRYFADQSNRLQELNKDSHDFSLEFQWKFLPKTSFVIDGKASLIRWHSESRGFDGGQLPNVDSTPIAGRAGLSGLFTPRISARLLGGYAVGLYESGPTYSGPVGRADITFKYGNLNLENKVVLGYERSYSDSNIGNFFSYHRGIFKLRQNFMQKRFGISIGAEYTHRDYADIQADARSEDLNQAEGPEGDIFIFDEFQDNSVDINAGIHGQFRKWWRASVNYTYNANFTDDQVDVPSATEDLRFIRQYQRHLVVLSTTFKY